MATSKATTARQAAANAAPLKEPTFNVPAATEGDARLAILGLGGVFRALNLIAVCRVATGDAEESYVDETIEGLIVAGEALATEIARRF